MGKLIVSRWLFDDVVADHVRQNLGDDYDYYQQATDALEIRKLPQIGGELDTVYIDFGGDLSSARAFAGMYGVPRESIVLCRDLARESPEYLNGRRARLKPINMDYHWSLLNWNHELHQRARVAIYESEQRYGSADA